MCCNLLLRVQALAPRLAPPTLNQPVAPHSCHSPTLQLVYRADDLKKPLRVTFVTGGVPEPAQDEGGVTKE